MTMNDLEPPLNLLNFSHFLAVAHISRVNCNEVTGGSPRQPAYKIFSIERKF